MRTIKQPLAHGGLHRFNHRRDRSDRTLLQIDARQRLLDLQRARMACFRINMIPVIEAKSNVAVFLDLEHHDAIAKRMNVAGLNKNALPAVGREAGEIIVRGLLRERPQIFGASYRASGRRKRGFPFLLRERPTPPSFRFRLSG